MNRLIYFILGAKQTLLTTFTVATHILLGPAMKRKP